tara:strand:- start:8978 stop:10426 length:1449 start_codon:yes stop_codon:yes gene_type:complete
MLPNRKQAFGGGSNVLGGSSRRNNVYSDDINWYKALNAGGVKRPNNRPTKEELKKERIKAEVKFEIDRTPVENMNYANVPPELLESVKAFVINQGRDHGKKGMIQKQMHESDLNRIDMKVEKDMIADSIPQLNSQFLELKQMRQEWAENNETDAVSDMVDPDAIEKINNALNNKMQMSYNAQGNIIFGEGDDAFELSSLPKYFNKDFASSKDIAKKNSQVFKNGVILNEQQQLMYENDFNEMLSKGGDETLLSLAFDKGLLGGPSHSYLNVDNYQDQLDAINGDDPTAAYEARAQIREDLTSKYMTALTQQAKDGFDAKQVLPPGSTVDVDTTINDWHATFTDPSKPPTIQDWRLQVQQFKGRKGTPWDDGFEIARSDDGAGTRTFTVKGQDYDEKTFYTDATYQTLYGMDIKDFEALPDNEKLKKSKAAGVTTKVSGGSSGGTYIVPNNASMSQANKFSIGYKIDDNLNKDEILKIINALK